jgi:DNA repair exonuclease SbcCD nuclease subunit
MLERLKLSNKTPKLNEKVYWKILAELKNKNERSYCGPFTIIEIKDDNKYTLANKKYKFETTLKSIKYCDQSLSPLYKGNIPVKVTKLETKLDESSSNLEEKEEEEEFVDNLRDKSFTDEEHIKETLSSPGEISSKKLSKRIKKKTQYYHDEY